MIRTRSNPRDGAVHSRRRRSRQQLPGNRRGREDPPARSQRRRPDRGSGTRKDAELDLAVVRNRGSIAVYANNGADLVSLDLHRHFRLSVRCQFRLPCTVGMAAVEAAPSTPMRSSPTAPFQWERGRRPAAAFALIWFTRPRPTRPWKSIAGKVLIDVSRPSKNASGAWRVL